MGEDSSQTAIYHSGLPFEDEVGLIAAEPYQDVTGQDLAQPLFRDCAQAAHVIIHATTNVPVIHVFNPKAAVYMQLRFDGHLGFPGGMVDSGETPEDAVNRELVEESGLSPGQIRVTEADLLAVHFSPSKKLILHLFAKKISLDLFTAVEKKTVEGREWADEVMGVLRVPLYTMSDGFRGFPAFLGSNFIGNSKQQLLMFLTVKGLLTKEEIEKALRAKPLKLAKMPESKPQ